MEPLFEKMTEETPAIILNPAKGKFQIVGKSWPENAAKFYGRIIKWFKEYFDNSPLEETVFEIRLTYFNTATSKQLIRLLFFLKEYGKKYNIKFQWYINEGDEETTHEAERFMQILHQPIEIIYTKVKQGKI